MSQKKVVVLGVTGGIAAYKAADIASKLVQAGLTVKTIMTKEAAEFITPLTFRNLTGQPVVTCMFDLQSEYSVEHVALAEEAAAIVIAPATANIIAKIACGIADDSLTCTVLATQSPVIVAPSMNDNMYKNPVTRENVDKLKKRNFILIEPEYGRLASGKIGQGRMAENQKIIDAVTSLLDIKL
jgi:phosphopantothenoylcysteine decarboxylase/phosphopantothenate--cysteine ligase